VVWRVGVERSGLVAERARGAEAQGLCSRSPVGAGGRVHPWEKLVATACRLPIFGVRFSEKRRAAAEFGVIGSRNCFLNLTILSAERSINVGFSPSARTAIPHGLGRVSKMMVMCV
jgi:hypothetical protein